MSDNLFPFLTREYVLSFQFSEWYSLFARETKGKGKLTIPSTIISPLDSDFVNYLRSDDPVIVPTGSDNGLVESTLSDDEDNDESKEEEEEDEAKAYSFPDLDAKIRACIKEHGGAVFPKLNYSSPKDAAWVLPQSSPLKCTSPADIYMLLKCSDFIIHDLTEDILFEHCQPPSSSSLPPYRLQLVLRKWYPMDPSRQFRCFVRGNQLIGISQRDPNFYDFWMNKETQHSVVQNILEFWKIHIQTLWKKNEDYVFDLLLTRDLTRGHILDMAPYSPNTDALLFTYQELDQLWNTGWKSDPAVPHQQPVLRLIDSQTHPAIISSAPANQHNMLPFETLSLGNGHTIDEFAGLFRDEIHKAL